MSRSTEGITKPDAEETREGVSRLLSRRVFIQGSACMVACMAAVRASGALGAEQPLIILENASGMLVADPARCVSCQRCELACTEFNNGKADLKLARIKVGRNMYFGPDGAGNGGLDHRGYYNSGLAIQDVCRQCKHPVPCATACPQNAIVAQPGSGTRIVDESRCVGCRICQRACPWNMMTFDEDAGKASKCFLCNGKPKCVEACPAQAIQYVPWSDRSRIDPARGAYIWSVPANKYAACAACHVDSPGGPRGTIPRN